MGFSEPVAISDREEESLHCVIIARGPVVSQPFDNKVDNKTSEAITVSRTENQRPCLIFADSQDVALTLADLLREKQITPVMIDRGGTFTRFDSGHFEIRPAEPDDIQQILDTVCIDKKSSPVLINM